MMSDFLRSPKTREAASASDGRKVAIEWRNKPANASQVSADRSGTPLSAHRRDGSAHLSCRGRQRSPRMGGCSAKVANGPPPAADERDGPILNKDGADRDDAPAASPPPRKPDAKPSPAKYQVGSAADKVEEAPEAVEAFPDLQKFRLERQSPLPRRPRTTAGKPRDEAEELMRAYGEHGPKNPAAVGRQLPSEPEKPEPDQREDKREDRRENTSRSLVLESFSFSDDDEVQDTAQQPLGMLATSSNGTPATFSKQPTTEIKVTVQTFEEANGQVASEDGFEFGP
eukprot:scaffold1583_cov299-Pinguiococcus_pyrenoidosus.AAC.15